MADLSTHHGLSAEEEENLPDTPYEHRVCGLTLAAALFLLSSGAYYLLAPADDGLKTILIMAASGIFGIVLLGFFYSAFTGKLCGQCKKHKADGD